LDTTNIINIVSIAYRDKNIVNTITSAIENADYPLNLKFNVIVQDSNYRIIDTGSIPKKIHYVKWDSIDGFSEQRFNIFKNIKDEELDLIYLFLSIEFDSMSIEDKILWINLMTVIDKNFTDE